MALEEQRTKVSALQFEKKLAEVRIEFLDSAMGFIEKTEFLRKRKATVLPTNVDASVSTEPPCTCHVVTITIVLIGGETNSYEYEKSYAHAAPQEYTEWCNAYTYRKGYGAYCRYTAHLRTLQDGPTAHPPALCRHTLPFQFSVPSQGNQPIIKGVILSFNASTLRSNEFIGPILCPQQFHLA
jgi:hypothetical protein